MIFVGDTIKWQLGDERKTEIIKLIVGGYGINTICINSTVYDDLVFPKIGDIHTTPELLNV